jgi:hypothetical protein
MAGGVILGDWTHRRRDAGGSRALLADVEKAKPELVWSFRPEHDGRVDQVRILGEYLYVATMDPGDADAPDWEHATIYCLDMATGRVVSKRVLPDPVPVSALMLERGAVHVVATRKEEPIFWYSLSPVTLKPLSRRTIELDRDGRREDVLDAWVSGSGAVWLELESAFGGGRAFAYIAEGASVGAAQTHEADLHAGEWGGPPRDACFDGQAMFAPLAGGNRQDSPPTPPSLWKVEPVTPLPHEIAGARTLTPPARDVFARAELVGENAYAHALAIDGMVYAVAAADPVDRDERLLVQAFAADAATGVMRWMTPVGRLPMRTASGAGARTVRRPNGELLFQRLEEDGGAATDVLCIKPEGEMDALALNGRRFVLDAALGDSVLAHHEAKSGRVHVGAFGIDREGRLLGRRASALWTVETPDLGGATTVYAGAGHVIVRGARALVAVRV